MDPRHRLIYEFVDEEIAQALGIDVFYLPPPAKVDKIAKLINTPIIWFLGIFLAISFRFSCSISLFYSVYFICSPHIQQIHSYPIS